MLTYYKVIKFWNKFSKLVNIYLNKQDIEDKRVYIEKKGGDKWRPLGAGNPRTE